MLRPRNGGLRTAVPLFFSQNAGPHLPRAALVLWEHLENQKESPHEVKGWRHWRRSRTVEYGGHGGAGESRQGDRRASFIGTLGRRTSGF
jgi:hypothetical protein